MKTRLRTHTTLDGRILLVLQIEKHYLGKFGRKYDYFDATIEDLTESINILELLNENPIKQ